MRATCIIGAILVALLATGCGTPAGDYWTSTKDLPIKQLLTARNTNRLYDGAPPVIPHEVAPLGRENCNNCHTPGSTENPDRIGPPRSHPAWGDCRQCHVERHGVDTFKANNFSALRWAARGHRQTAISPPMIPHGVQNREDCAVCHVGEQAPAALRAAHGHRSECRQCHVAMNP